MSKGSDDDAVRIAARLRTAAGDGRVIAFTAGQAHEGAGVVCCGVAAALARMGVGTVLIIDANLRAPLVHTRVGAPGTPGLADYLRQQASFDAVVHACATENLSTVPAGKDAAEVMALLTGPVYGDLIDAARARYAYVVVAAPLLGESAETAVVAAKSDGIVLVVRAGVHSRAALADMRRDLEGLAAPLLGCVLSGSSE